VGYKRALGLGANTNIFKTVHQMDPKVILAVDQQVIQRVKVKKARQRRSRARYRERSKVAFVVHSFNRISNVEQLVGGLRGLGTHELIVCEDGSLDGSHEKWMSHLNRPNNFMIHSNDLHEIRILDRAIGLPALKSSAWSRTMI
jgi:hypothetical protein